MTSIGCMIHYTWSRFYPLILILSENGSSRRRILLVTFKIMGNSGKFVFWIPFPFEKVRFSNYSGAVWNVSYLELCKMNVYTFCSIVNIFSISQLYFVKSSDGLFFFRKSRNLNNWLHNLQHFVDSSFLYFAMSMSWWLNQSW